MRAWISNEGRARTRNSTIYKKPLNKNDYALARAHTQTKNSGFSFSIYTYIAHASFSCMYGKKNQLSHHCLYKIYYIYVYIVVVYIRKRKNL